MDKTVKILLVLIIVMLGYLIYQVEKIPKEKTERELMRDQIRDMIRIE